MSNKILRSLTPKVVEEDDDFVTVDRDLIPDEEEADYGSDSEKNHSKLMDDISVLASNKKSLKWKATRFESNPEVNEFNFSRSKQNLSISDLIKSVKDSSGIVKKQLKHFDKKKLLDPPLEKLFSKQLKRVVAYDQTKEEVSKWDSTVEHNRNASQLYFPVIQNNLRLEPSREIVKHFVPKTKLEIEVSELLKKSDNNVIEDNALTAAEERLLKAMSLEEAKQRHKELQKVRALMSYQEIKLKRQSKIKSKRFHRILKKEKLKKSLDEFEKMKKTDPELAVEKLNELEKLRALERASLKHKNTGKWAKHNKLRSKYDDNARNAITEQLELGKKLLKKNQNFDSDEETDGKNGNKSSDETKDEDKHNSDSDFEELPQDFNPWMRSGKQIIDKTKKIPEITNLFTKTSPKVLTTITSKVVTTISPEINENLNDEPINFETTTGLNSDINELTEVNNVNKEVKELKSNPDNPLFANLIENGVHIDPNDFMTIKSHKIKSSFTNMITEMDSDVESVASDDEQRKLVAEAFADDDVIDEFNKEKLEKIENEDEKDISLHLPGWGSWAGEGIKQNKRKIKQFTKKGNKIQRKDDKIGNAIITEKKDLTIAKYQINQLPFPFKNVKQFENSIRQPIGRTWNTESAFRDLTQPKIVTKMGTIIEPIDKESLIQSKVRRPFVRNKMRNKNKKHAKS